VDVLQIGVEGIGFEYVLVFGKTGFRATL